MILKIVLSSILCALVIALGIYYLVKLNKTNKRITKEEDKIYLIPNEKGKAINISAIAIVFACSIALIVCSVLNVIKTNTFFLCYIVLIFVLYFGVKSFIYQNFTYYVVDNEKIEANYLFRKKEAVFFNQIAYPVFQNSSLYLLDNEKKTLMSVQFNIHGLNLAIKKMYEHEIKFDVKVLKYFNIELNEEDKEKIEENKEPSQEEIDQNNYLTETYTSIGKEFRENKNKNFKNDVIKACAYQIFLILCIILFAILLKNYIIFALLLFNVYLAYSKYKELKSKYDFKEMDDYELGKKFASLNPKVIGYHDNKIRMVKSYGIFIGVLLVIFVGFSGYNAFSKKTVNYDGLTTISGTITSINLDNSNTLKIKINDEENKYSKYEFQLPSQLNKYINLDEILTKNDKNAIIKVGNLDEKNLNGIYYYLEIDSKEYVNLSILDKYMVDYQNGLKRNFYISLGAVGIIIGCGIGYFIYNKKQIKNETIDLSNKNRG